jgi:hypothetical protein
MYSVACCKFDSQLQDSELRASIVKEKESLQQTKKLLQDSKSEALSLGMERDSLQKQLDLQQKQHSQFLETFKATKEDESSSRSLLTESTVRHEAMLARLMKEQESERASLSARADKLQKQCDELLQAKRDVEQQLQEREISLRQAIRERDEVRVDFSKAQAALDQMKAASVDISVHQRLLDQVREERAAYASRIEESSKSYKDELAARQRQWDAKEVELKVQVEVLQNEVSGFYHLVRSSFIIFGLQVTDWKSEFDEEVEAHKETVSDMRRLLSVCICMCVIAHDRSASLRARRLGWRTTKRDFRSVKCNVFRLATHSSAEI